MYGTPLTSITHTGDRYGFVNEIHVRTAAGITLILALISFVSIAFFASYTLPLILMPLIWLDFAARVLLSPRHSLVMWIAAQITTRTMWIGSVQKRFTWALALVLTTIALGCVLITSGTLPRIGIATSLYATLQTMPITPGLAVPFTLPLLVCIVCIVLMALEALAGFCVGCYIYAFLTRRGIMRTIPNQTCADGVCSNASLALY